MQNSAHLNGELKDLRRNIGDLSNQLETMMKLEKKAAKNRMSEVKEDGQSEIRAMLAQTQEQLNALRESFSDRAKQAEKTVADHPWASLMGAVGVGLALGKLLDSRTQH